MSDKPKRQGRPRSPNPLTELIGFTVTPQTRARIESAMRRVGSRNISAFCREAVAERVNKVLAAGSRQAQTPKTAEE